MLDTIISICSVRISKSKSLYAMGWAIAPHAAPHLQSSTAGSKNKNKKYVGVRKQHDTKKMPTDSGYLAKLSSARSQHSRKLRENGTPDFYLLLKSLQEDSSIFMPEHMYCMYHRKNKCMTDEHVKEKRYYVSGLPLMTPM